jgi:SCY1-like protein 1
VTSVYIVADTHSAPIAYAPSTSNSLDQTAPALSSSSVDGWGELENDNQGENGSDNEGWDDVDPFEEKSAPSLLSNIQAAQKRPVVQPKQPGKLYFFFCDGSFVIPQGRVHLFLST